MEDAVENILPYERDWFLGLNSFHSEFWDYFMSIYSGKLIWIPLSVVILCVLLYKQKVKEAILVILAFALLATLCDQISASVIKPFFARPRPTHHPDFQYFVTIVDGYRGGRFGFISSHATNGFGVAVFISFLFRNKYLTASVFFWALVNSYSRIYLGVHFISDIIGGVIVGSFLGFMVYYLYNLTRNKILKVEYSNLRYSLYSSQQAIIVCGTIATSVLTIVIISLYAISF